MQSERKEKHDPDGLDEENVSEESLWELEEELDRADEHRINFDYYYELKDDNPYQDSYKWHEMSYNRERTSWDAIEKTELELFEEEDGIF